jgi:ATP-dependent RNA helicase HelY
VSRPHPSPTSEFEQTYGFVFDPFQQRACAALEDGSSVLVAAPTGAGKTVVGEFAAWLALKRGGKTFYTTPIKALSNQKYGDFVALHGPSNVGLLTGDNSLNPDAPLVVMTTEVLRNMIYEDSPELSGLHYVVLDEVHYLQDPYRGGVWEEILIHLPVDVLTVSLSATVSNAEEFAEWMQTLRGRVEVVIEERRPVELRHWYFTSDELLPTFIRTPDGRVIPNPQARRLERRRRGATRPARGGQRPRPRRPRAPLRSDVVERLETERMLPAIYFIFSRRGCADAVRQCLHDGVRLTTPEERDRIVEYAEMRVTELSADELAVLGFDQFIQGLARGIAAHHAGMIPPFKETVEDLFARGLIKVVFATETLALGINMPARTVVIESLNKFTGEKHELMTPGEYTQLAGRAGRRGIDEVGHCVVLYQRFVPFDTITRLASARTYPLQSSFRPSYNMAVNLVRNYDRSDAEHLVNSSFAQFQADRDVVRLEHSKEQLEAYLASYREKMRCELGDFDEYRRLHDRLRRREDRAETSARRTRATRVAEAIESLRPGDVIDVPTGKRRGRYAVVEVARRRSERQPRVLALSEERSMVRFAPSDFRYPPVPVARIRLPDPFHVRDSRARRDLARRLAAVRVSRHGGRERAPDDAKELKTLRGAIESHPVHKCPDLSRHLHFAERAQRLEKELRGIERRINRRTGTLARRFERVLGVLEELDYVQDWSLAPKGITLARVYNEADLLVVEALERRLFDGLEPPELAGVLSALVYEARGPEVETPVEFPTLNTKSVVSELMNMWRRIRGEEQSRGLELIREPDAGFVDTAYLWASGAPLDQVLGEEDAPGDFVRVVKQLVDLMRQLVEIAEPDLAAKMTASLDGLHRGVVAYSSLEV